MERDRDRVCRIDRDRDSDRDVVPCWYVSIPDTFATYTRHPM